MNRLVEKFLSLLYPKGVVCHACGMEAIVNEAGLCAACAAALCPCEKPHPLLHADGFTAGLEYTDVIAGAVHRFKYNDARYLAPFLASFITIPADWELDAIVPVPLHKRRLRRRGYNQSALLAQALSEHVQAPVREDLLMRIRNTGTQTALGAKERRRNLRGAFVAKDEAKGMRLLLIDDVRTTGATLDACAQALRQAGAATVYACAVCERERDA